MKFKASRRSQKDVLNIKFEFKPPRVRAEKLFVKISDG